MAKKKPLTRLESEHIAEVVSLGCVAVRFNLTCGRPAVPHHLPRGGAYRDNHFEVIPLCPYHHTDGPYSEAVHQGRRGWEEKHGTERELLAKTLNLLKKGI